MFFTIYNTSYWQQFSFEILSSLITNPTFVLLSLADSADWILLNGMATFFPKFVIEQYQLSTSDAGTQCE